MVLPVGGFFPIPLAMMIPFMATQSLVMGEAFGKAFQFGKRKISAMSNEEFNKLDIETVASNMFASYKRIEGDLKESISQSTEFQQFIFKELILLGPELIKAIGGAVGEVAPTPAVEPPPGPVVTVPTGKKAKDVFATTIKPFTKKASKVFSQFKPTVAGRKKIVDENQKRGIRNQLVVLNRQLSSLEIARNHVRTKTQSNYINRKIIEIQARIRSQEAKLK